MNLNGHTSKIKTLAKPITLFDDSVTVWYLPYTPVVQSVIRQQLLNSASEDEKLNGLQALFSVLHSVIVDMEFDDGYAEEVAPLAVYWACREGDNVQVDYLAFMSILSNEIIDVLWNGYQDTRAKLPQAPAITQEGKPEAEAPLEVSGKKRIAKSS